MSTTTQLPTGRAAEILTEIVKGYTNTHESFKVREIPTSSGRELIFWVHKCEMGKVVGKGGATIAALKKVMAIIGSTYGLQIRVTLDEPITVGAGDPRDKLHPWDQGNFDDYVGMILDQCEPVSQQTFKVHHGGKLSRYTLENCKIPDEILNSIRVIVCVAAIACGRIAEIEK